MRNHPLLRALHASGIRLGVDRVRGFLNDLGSPQKCAPMVHVAGTNGKGSVCSMVDAIMQEAGYRTGLTVSPHLQHVNERIRISGKAISDEDLDRLLCQVDAWAKAWGARHLSLQSDELPLTYFEAMIAAAFVHFQQEDVAVGVVEVGLGGRLDATSVLHPAVSAVVSVGLDHLDRLGPDLASVAYEKAGVFRGSVPAVVGDVPREAMRVLRDTAASKGAPLFVLGEDFLVSGNRESFDWEMGGVRLEGCSLGLEGAFQVKNAAVALAIVELLERGGVFSIPHDARRRGLEGARHPGRLEWISESILVDGAHNADAAVVLADHLRCLPRNQPRSLLLGMNSDKDVRLVASTLAPHVDRIFTTRCAHPKALEPEAMARELAHLALPVEPAGPIEEALPRVGQEEGVVVVAGSLFLAGAVRDLFGRA